MVDHLNLKMLLVRLSVGGLSHMQVYHCPHPKLVHLLLFRVHGSSLHLPSQGALAPNQDHLLPSPCRETLPMVDHLRLKMVALSNLKAFLPSISLGPSTFLMIQKLLVKVHWVLQLLRSWVATVQWTTRMLLLRHPADLPQAASTRSRAKRLW